MGAKPMSDLNRRQFVTLATIAATATCAACACSAEAADAPAEGKESEKPSSKGPPPNVGTVNVGKKTKYNKSGVSDEFAKKNRVLVICHEGKIYAPTATCTHKNCAVKVKEANIVCACHGSKFSLQGTSTKGPAKGSLYRYAISVNADGDIIVNKEKQFDEKNWENPEAFITV
jgi:cytochrome b6-f complex iron-sulfur subunit